MSSSATHLSLINRIRSDRHDQDAWREFIERYGTRVYQWCLNRKLQTNDAEDVSIIGVEQGGFIDGGNNLIGVDPMLGPLADNGGPTKTHALLDGSPAIDAGGITRADAKPNDKPAVEFDQRGKPFKRVVDGNGDGTATHDIGAFENSGM